MAAGTSGGSSQAPSRGLATAELLAKIDALDWEQTVIGPDAGPATAPLPGATVTPGPRRPRRAWAIAAAVLLAGATLATWWLATVPGQPPGAASATAAVSVAPATVAAPTTVSAPDDAARLAAVEAEENARRAKFEEAVRRGEEVAWRKAERQRKAREDEARSAEEQRDRQRAEDARAQAERQAAEARANQVAAPPAAPRAPTSPQELCVGETNVFARSHCESQVCGKPEWQKHPYCMKRLEDVLRRLSPGV
jgi:hypothetical protein